MDARLITPTLASVRMNARVRLNLQRIFNLKYTILQGIPKRVFVQMDPLTCGEHKCIVKQSAMNGADQATFK